MPVPIAELFDVDWVETEEVRFKPPIGSIMRVAKASTVVTRRRFRRAAFARGAYGCIGAGTSRALYNSSHSSIVRTLALGSDRPFGVAHHLGWLDLAPFFYRGTARLFDSVRRRPWAK